MDKDKVRPRGREAREENDNYQRKEVKKPGRTDNNGIPVHCLVGNELMMGETRTEEKKKRLGQSVSYC